MIGAAVGRLDGWAVTVAFFVGSALMIASPIFLIPSYAGIAVGIFTGLVIAGSVYEARRKEILGLPKLSDPFQITAPIQIASRLVWRLVRMGVARFRGIAAVPLYLNTPPRVWCTVRDAYGRRLGLRVGIAIALVAILMLVPVLMNPTSGHIRFGLASFLVSSTHLLEVYRRIKLGIPQAHPLLMPVAPVRMFFRLLVRITGTQRGDDAATIVKPPLFRLDTLARFLWSQKTYTRVFRAHQLEIIHEWCEAERMGERRRATYIRYVGGPLSMLWHMVMQIPTSAVDLVIRAIK